jgi:Trypsin-co-occurring domain 1
MNAKSSASEKVIYIEVQDTRGMVVPQADAREFAKLTDERLREVAETARSTANALVTRLTEFSKRPSKVGLEFGIGVGGEAGVPFVAKGTVQAQFKVSIEWSGDDLK